MVRVGDYLSTGVKPGAAGAQADKDARAGRPDTALRSLGRHDIKQACF